MSNSLRALGQILTMGFLVGWIHGTNSESGGESSYGYGPVMGQVAVMAGPVARMEEVAVGQTAVEMMEVASQMAAGLMGLFWHCLNSSSLCPGFWSRSHLQISWPISAQHIRWSCSMGWIQPIDCVFGITALKHYSINTDGSSDVCEAPVTKELSNNYSLHLIRIRPREKYSLPHSQLLTFQQPPNLT